MPCNITQIMVMPQTEGPHGYETCGYHTFKNTLLSLLFLQEVITLEQMQTYAKNQQLFRNIFTQIKIIQNVQGNVDLTLPMMVHHMHLTKLGQYDFFDSVRATPSSAPQISDLMRLHLDRDGEQDLSIANIILAPNAPDLGLYGMEEDLFSAAALFKLARNQGHAKHVFAIGMGDKGHWVTVAMSQQAPNQRQWLFMDSNDNSTRLQQSAVSRIESVLNKSHEALKRYLLDVYVNSSRTFLETYNLHFYAESGEARLYGLHDQNAEQYYVKNQNNLELQSQWIENRFIFMRACGWLDSTEIEEQKHIHQLYWLSKYICNHIHDHATPIQLEKKARLQPICDALEHAFPQLLSTPPYDEFNEQNPERVNLREEPAHMNENALETNATIEAMQRKPKATEGFLYVLVRAIRWLFEKVKDCIVHVAQSIGLVY